MPSRSELAQLLDAAPVLIWASGPDKGGTYFNRAWRDFTGRPLDELVGEGWVADVHPDDFAALAACQGAFTSQQPFQTEFRLRRHDDTWRCMLDAGTPRFGDDGRFKGYVGACTDISELREAEATLRGSEARLQLAQEAAGFGTYDWDVVTDRITWSPEMFRLYGIDPATPGDAIYAAWLERLHPEDRDHADAETRRFVEEAGHLKINFRIVLPDGDVRWIEGRGRMFRAPDGRPLRMIGVNFDVTEQRRREEALRDSEQRLRDIAENFPGIIFRRITYPDGRVEYPYFSGVDSAIFNIPREQIEAIHTMEDVATLIHVDDLPGMLEKFRQASETLTPLDVEGRVVAGDGKVAWVRSISRPRPREDGSLIWDGVILDVTEHRLREGERERASTMLRMAIDVAGIGTWEAEPAADTIVGSAVTNELFGLPADGAARSPEEYRARIHPDDVERVRRNIAAAVATRGTVEHEFRVRAADGTERWIASRGAVVRLADGSERIIGALSDVTERRRREEEREAALEHQRRLLRELNHRIKNNLQMITSVLLLQASRMGEDSAAGGFATAIDRVQTISDLHAQLGVDGELGPVDFGRYLEDLCGKLRRSLLDNDRIALTCTTERCLIDLDRAVPLGLIANELVTNALKHAFPDDRSGRVLVSIARDADGSLRLTVGDDGVAPPARGGCGGLGARLVEGLSRQIGAASEVARGPGLVHTLLVPVAKR